MATATSRVRCWAQPTRRCTETLLSSFRDAPVGAGPESILPIVVMNSLMCNCTSKRARSRSSGRALRGPVGAPGMTTGPSPKRKRTNSRWPSIGINSPANRPDPDGPGGLGAEESGTERTGPTQYRFFAGHGGGRWAEVGQQYDSANVPVTRCVPRHRTIHRDFRRIYNGPCGARRLAQSCRFRHDPDPKDRASAKVATGFRNRFMPGMPGGAR